MSRRIYRVCRAIHARLDGEGSKRVGGRWNSPGKSVVYMAETVSLAVLENLVHMSKEDFPTGYVVVAAVVPDEIRVLKEGDLKDQFGGLIRDASVISGSMYAPRRLLRSVPQSCLSKTITC